MKKAILFLFSFGIGAVAMAAQLVTESPVNGYGTPVTISISSSTWTKVPTTQASGRVGMFFANPTGNNTIVGHMGNCTSTSVATTVRPLQYAAGTNSPYIPIREDVCLWLLTTNTSAAESIHIQEAKQ